MEIGLENRYICIYALVKKNKKNWRVFTVYIDCSKSEKNGWRF